MGVSKSVITIQQINEFKIIEILYPKSCHNIVTFYEMSKIKQEVVIEKLSHTKKLDMIQFIKHNGLIKKFVEDLTNAREFLHDNYIVHNGWSFSDDLSVGYSENDECFKVFKFELGTIVDESNSYALEYDKRMFNVFICNFIESVIL